MRSIACCLVFVVLAATTARADERDPLAWPHDRPIADWLSTIGAGANITIETIQNWRAPDRRTALTCETVQLATAIVAAEFVKRIVQRWRPDGSDRRSFYSEHTSIAEAASGWRFGAEVAIGVGYGRMAAAKHHASDVAVGFGAGWLARKVCQ